MNNSNKIHIFFNLAGKLKTQHSGKEFRSRTHFFQDYVKGIAVGERLSADFGRETLTVSAAVSAAVRDKD